jgi:molybdopterin-guanine dinucleotide biosynthesis protein A
LTDQHHNQTTERDLRAAILAGGASTRMGANKALLRLAPLGPTVIEVVVERLREAGQPNPLLVTNTPDDYAFLHLESVPDDIPGAGALGGILTAIRHSGAVRTLVIACDMPLLSPALIQYMVSVPGLYDALVPRLTMPDGTLRPEPMHAIYTPICALVAARLLESGRHKVGDLLGEVGTVYLDESDILPHDPALLSFANANTPDEWERVRSNWAAEHAQ